MKYFKFLIIVFIVCFGISAVSAAHIIGGDVTYRCLMIDSAAQTTTYQINCTIYRDSRGGGAPFDAEAVFGVFLGSGTNWNLVRRVNSMPRNIRDITFSDDPCIIIPPKIGVEEGKYTFDITLPWSTRTYKIAYQRCCRNNTITNIVTPETTGAVFEVDILPFAQTACNNSPVFNEFPPIVICTGVPLITDQSASDAEGDQLLYEFCAPLAAGGVVGATIPGDPEGCDGVTPDPARCGPPFATTVFRTPTYTATNPMGTPSGVTINQLTGLITGNPNTVGQYVVGVCVKEFRDGQLIGEIRRDFQFNVTDCEIAVQADLEPTTNGTTLEEPSFNVFNIKSCGATTIDITNLSGDVRNIDNYLWRIFVPGDTMEITTRDASFAFPDYGTYSGQMILNPGSAGCNDTAFLNLEIFPPTNADFTFAYDTCIAGPVTFTDQSTTLADTIVEWSWDYNTGDSDTLNNPSYRFQSPGLQNVSLRVTDNNGCTGFISKVISWTPVPDLIIIEPSQFIGCRPANIFFNNLSTPIDSTYDIRWTFGDVGTSNEISPTFLFEEAGIFNVNIEITSPIGCFNSRAYNQLIQILDKPQADFTYTPEEPSIVRKEVDFTDLSIDAVSWFWNFGGVGAAFEQNPTFDFPDTGIYLVDLVVVHPEGCTDTLSQVIDVKPLVTLHMPNAFTPNNDGNNDSFKGVGLVNGITEYNLKIWNRWGALLFESDDPNIGWNGEMNNNGTLVQQGVYVYTLSYRGPRGEPKEEKGIVTLIR